MRITLDQSTELEFENGFWNVIILKETNKNHHLTKHSVKEVVEHCGDFDRCIKALQINKVSTYTIEKLYNAYVKCLKKFKEADTYDFDDKVTWSIGDAKAQTNKNFRGVLCEYTYPSTHGKPTGNQMTMPDHKGIAKGLLNKNVYRYMSDNSFNSLCDAMVTFSDMMVEQMANATRV